MFRSVTAFLESFSLWASAQPDIEGVALVGSYARDAATEESDVDLLILTPDVAGYLRDRSWLSRFGEAAPCREEDWGRVTSLRAFYEGGPEVEYGFSTPDLADVPVDPGTSRVVSDGMKILYDPRGLLATLQREVVSGRK
ncbi:MAG: nucleotidyltransferase domain-containing protein [Pyrinomonadaceae bacterium]